MSEGEKIKEVLRALAKLAKTSEFSINELRIILALERLVARLVVSKVLHGKLIFKGGYVLFRDLGSPRFTRDLDALARGIAKEEIAAPIEEALALDLDDGVYFGTANVQELVDQGQYGGLRISVPFQIGPLPAQEHKIKKLSRVHLDVGFGDVFFGRAKQSSLKPLIEGAKAVSWNIYPAETIFAEKLETLISRGSANSRGRDLYDLLVIYRLLGSSRELRSAIEKTFSNRSTSIPQSFIEFLNALDLTVLQNSWGAVQLSVEQMSFEQCVDELEDVLREIDTLFKS